MSKKALLFLNGEFPKHLPDISIYDITACTDGAVHNMPKHIKPDFIIGDLDSIELNSINPDTNVIYLPDQNKTDFEKSVEYLYKKGYKIIDVYGASGNEHDHFLGNLSVAIQFQDKVKITFYDDFSTYFICDKSQTIETHIGTIISLMPFCYAEGVTIKGLEYPLNNENLMIGHKIGIRNKAISQKIKVSYKQGLLIIFIKK